MISKQRIIQYFSLFLISMAFACSPAKKINPDYLYFQDETDNLGRVQFKDLTIQPNDLLSILVFSKTVKQDDAALFNIPGKQGYLVGADGKIEIPLVGEVVASGLTRLQLEQTLQEKLLPYVKDPSVVVRFQELKINVLGEVRSPGVKTFPIDRVTIIDAITLSGDLSETGRRDNVTVIREEKDGRRKRYEIDLRSTNIFNSPVYQLQQNDIVYVKATDSKLKLLKERKNTLQTVQLVTSLVSVATTLVFLIIR